MLALLKKTLIQSELCPIIYNYSEVSSTNNVAERLIVEKNNIGFVVIAERQSSGKGQGKRNWESPQGGLWASLVIQPQIELSQLGIIPILSALGIAKALEAFDIKVLLKWPNDILSISKLKKIGGILIEAKVTQFSLSYLIIGIGLNINSTLSQYSRGLQDHITTVYEEYDKKLDLMKLLHEIICQIEILFECLRINGSQSILEEWKKKDNIIGMKVTVQTPEGDYQGKVVDISQHGQLILENSKSELIKISSGRVLIQDIK
ncbi:MAG: biotin--[acetyl-CoA-carboxylase] ligase [Candidatus Thorarchaeota archaeon]